MTWAIDTETLEQAIVRHCSPTLAGLKPASLFTFPGSFTGEPEHENKAALLRAIDNCRAQLSAAQVHIRVLAWRKSGALVYVFRPRDLAVNLRAPQAASILERRGYKPCEPAHCLHELQRRLSSMDDADSFPHEVGLFLGYPPADVAAFICNNGKGYAALGLWKAYENPGEARATWARFHRCTRALMRTYHARGSLAAVAVHTSAPASASTRAA